MKEPMRVVGTDLCFEKATIEVWLNSRGQVCPIRNVPLFKDQLKLDEDLRNRIKRYHIEQTALRLVGQGSTSGASSQPTNDFDDLYDF